MKNLLVFMVVATLALSAVSARKCYVCEGEECDKQIKGKETVECDLSSTVNPTSSTATSDLTSSTGTENPSGPPTTEDPTNSTTTENPTNSTETEDTGNSTAAINKSYKLPNNENTDKKYFNYLRQRREANDPSTTKEPAEEYNCLKYETDDEKPIVVRKCTTVKVCKDITEESNMKKDSCKICSEDGCNFGTSIQSWAFSTLILVAVVKFFL